MGTYKYQEKYCQVCNKKIELFHPVYMGNDMVFCSFMCRKQLLLKKKYPIMFNFVKYF